MYFSEETYVKAWLILETTYIAIYIYVGKIDNNKKYSYSEVTDIFTMIILVIALSGYSIGALLEVKYPLCIVYQGCVIFPFISE